MSAPVVLHGDLHHYNILAATREQSLAIDPQGVIGEPEYEVGALLRNPFDLVKWQGLRGIMLRRIEHLLTKSFRLRPRTSARLGDVASSPSPRGGPSRMAAIGT